MDKDERVSLAAIAGGVLMVVSFIVYIFVPESILLFTFALGVVLLIGGYTYMCIRLKRLDAVADSHEEVVVDGSEPTIISLDGEYAPFDDSTPEGEPTVQILE
jgi:hypothetical protein